MNKNENVDGQDDKTTVKSSRRDFMQGAVGVGLAGLAGTTALGANPSDATVTST